MPGPWLILPTYNEAENIEPLVRAVLPQLESTGLPHTVLVVDDNSPDGTGQIADRLAEEIERVRVLHRPQKQGLGRAYLAGFEVALEGGADLILEMDSDFSHNPADVPRLIAATAGADLVLGSRYVAGGDVGEWGRIRRAISRAGSNYARRWLGLGIRDLTGGFKCFRREVLEAIDLESVSALGYAFQIETTYRTAKAGFRVVEVPIFFHDRRVGESKMSRSIVAEAAWRVPRMRLCGHRG